MATLPAVTIAPEVIAERIFIMRGQKVILDTDLAASLLSSPRAVQVSVYVVRAFVQQREFLASNKELTRQLKVLEQRIAKKLSTHDQAIAGIIDTLRVWMSPATANKRRIGFVIDDEKK